MAELLWKASPQLGYCVEAITTVVCGKGVEAFSATPSPPFPLTTMSEHTDTEHLTYFTELMNQLLPVMYLVNTGFWGSNISSG